MLFQGDYRSTSQRNLRVLRLNPHLHHHRTQQESDRNKLQI